MTTFRKTFEQYLAASYPAFYITTHEESRAADDIKAVAKSLNRPVAFWTATQGWLQPTGQVIAPAKDPKSALEAIAGMPEDVIAVMKDFHPFIENPMVTRLLRDVLPVCEQMGKPIVFLSPIAKIPIELEKDITILEYAMPTREELTEVVEVIRVSAEAEAKSRVVVDDPMPLLEAARGLTVSEARNAFSLAWARHSNFGPDAVKTVRNEKAITIKKTGLVSWIESEQTVDLIGGLENAKAYVRMIAPTFHHPDRAEAFGLRPEDFPRSILLMGPAGTGKSSLAKAIAHELKIGLVHSDFGKMFGREVGSSESNILRRNNLVEAMSPCVDWWDEAEKGLAGIKGSTGNPWEARVGGSLLTWFEEHRARVLVVATVNRFEDLPAEMISRFQKTFLVGLPNKVERTAIFRIHLELRKLALTQIELDRLALVSDGYSGREIRNAIQAAMQTVFARTIATPVKGLTMRVSIEDIEDALAAITPLSKSRKADVDRIMEFAREHNIASASAETDEVKPIIARRLKR